MTIEETVRQGIAWLDENGPANWRKLVDLDNLEMSSPWYCVLGRVFRDKSVEFGGYIYAKHVLGCPVYECGFAEDVYSFKSLQNAWIAELSK